MTSLLRMFACVLALVWTTGCGRARDALLPNAVSSAPKPVIQIDGVKDEVLANVRAYLSLARESCDAQPWRVRQLYKRADAEIEKALRALGYYEPEIGKSIEFGESCWEARFRVQPGEPVEVRSVEVTIDGQATQDTAFLTLTKNLSIKQNERLNHAHYEQTKQSIANLAAERGYFDGRFTKSELRVDPSRRRADVDLDYSSGPRYRFGRLQLHQDALDPDLVKRLVSITEGEPYDSATLAQASAALTDSGYFERVDVRPRIEEAEGDQVPIDVTLSPRKRRSYSLGAGFGTDTGPRLKLGYENSRVNRGGNRSRADVSLSPVLSETDAEYRIPLANPGTDWVSLQVGYRFSDTDAIRGDTLRAGASVITGFPENWLQTAFVRFLAENTRVGSTRSEDTLVIPGINWARTEADDAIRPRRGYRAQFELRGSLQELGSDAAFLRTNLSLKGVQEIPWTGGRVIGRSDLGATMVNEVTGLPASQRFFAGGDSSVRGYVFQSLGPEDSDGDNAGGRYLIVNSIEYEQPVTGAWSVAAFVDTGNAFDDSTLDLRTGAGLGLRWASPVGPVRLDLAHPFDDNDDVVRFHFTLGPDL